MKSALRRLLTSGLPGNKASEPHVPSCGRALSCQLERGAWTAIHQGRRVGSGILKLQGLDPLGTFPARAPHVLLTLQGSFLKMCSSSQAPRISAPRVLGSRVGRGPPRCPWQLCPISPKAKLRMGNLCSYWQHLNRFLNAGILDSFIDLFFT